MIKVFKRLIYYYFEHCLLNLDTRLIHLKLKTRFTFIFEIPSIPLESRKRSNIPNRLPLFQLRNRRARESGDFNSEVCGRAPRIAPNRNIPLKIPAEGLKRRRARTLGAQFYLRHRRPAIFLGDARLISNVPDS